MLLRELPPELGSPGRVGIVYFVAITSWSRRDRANSPTICSAVPFVYAFAVSMKFPPRST